MIKRRRTYLIQDPYDWDAVQFIQTIFTCFGLRPVCFYTDRKARFYGEREFPILSSDLVEAAVDVRLDDLPSFVTAMRDRYEIAAVIPYREDTVEVAADLCALLDLPWNDAATVRRFRDKGGLLRHVHSVDPTIRLPEFRIVESVHDVLAAPTPERIVIKPNSGFGNRAIGIFDRGARNAVGAHIEGHQDGSWILEEYIGGTEYNCNGQVRPNGDVMIHGIFRYRRADVNGCATVYDAEIQCHTHHPAFDSIVDYATRVLTATGLRGCPFHLELKIDDRGPCLIDLGARLPSEWGGHQLSRLHPDRPDVYTIAAHDYFGVNTFADVPTDWARHDESTSVLMYGISEGHTVIASLDGIEEVEARPEFVHWVVKPSVGDRLVPTRELREAPYIAMLCHDGDDTTTDALLADVRSTIRWNTSCRRAARAQAIAGPLVRRAHRKLCWFAASGFRRLRTTASGWA